jgi:preprotein translocase subunit SecE
MARQAGSGSREGMSRNMAKTEAITTGNENAIIAQVKSWPEKTRDFYHDVRTETKKVTTPSWKEVQATTAVVIITVFLFAGYFFVVDLVLGNGLDRLMHWLARR